MNDGLFVFPSIVFVSESALSPITLPSIFSTIKYPLSPEQYQSIQSSDSVVQQPFSFHLHSHRQQTSPLAPENKRPNHTSTMSISVLPSPIAEGRGPVTYNLAHSSALGILLRAALQIIHHFWIFPDFLERNWDNWWGQKEAFSKMIKSPRNGKISVGLTEN